MKNLIFINGTMGVGKTATSRELHKILPKSVFLDGDWCWDMSPFIITDETKNMVQNNIVYVLNSFISCSKFENIIFCWVMHETWIFEDLLSKVNKSDCNLYKFSIVCTDEVLITRIEQDIEQGKRTYDVMERSLSRLNNYLKMDTVKIDVSDMSAIQAAEKIAGIINES